MPHPRPRLRLAAALLAWLGLLALPLRTIAACPMVEVAGVDASLHHGASVVTQISNEQVGHDEHAGHEMPDADDEAPSAPDAPAHEPCPDLAHCAVAAISPPLTLPAAPTVPVATLRIAALTAPMSVGRALEPPPPKA